jgi:alkanesulfonate monooxygenase SsuD/methylene tetrahydromethanopterin reductase-like flavin-dependent oxidoreductase (luciferase family)
MQIGFNLPISGPLAEPATIVRLAREGEALGYDYLTLTDHIVLPDLKVPGYPYSESGEFFGDGPQRRHEILTAAAFVAAATSRIRLVLAVLVVPYRPAVLAAKMLATIDVLSGGRLVVGIGAGWLEAEFNAVATTPFAARGAVTDEYIRAFPPCGPPPSRSLTATGSSSAASCSNPNRRKSRIRRSGSAARAGRRCAAQRGSATRGTRSAATTGISSIRSRATAPGWRGCGATETAGRDPTAIALNYRVKRYGESVPPVASDGERRLFSGDGEAIAGDLRALRELGVSAIDIDFERPDAEASLAAMHHFRETVLGRI